MTTHVEAAHVGRTKGDGRRYADSLAVPQTRGACARAETDAVSIAHRVRVAEIERGARVAGATRKPSVLGRKRTLRAECDERHDGEGQWQETQ